jgi:hypothetical protein
MDTEQTIAEIEWLERTFAEPETAESKQHLGCESQARRDARA